MDESYEPRCVLVTGGAGFIGSHVVIRLVREFPNARIVCIDKLEYCSTLKNLAEVIDAPNFKFIRGDITSVDLVNYVLREEAVDTIMHFAAQSHVDNSFGNSFTFTHNNVMGTHVLLEASKRLRSQIRRFVHVSTDEVYGENEEGCDVPFAEDSALDPTNPYAATKAAAEFIAKAYFRSFGLPVIITRGNNVYGPHQYPEKLVPKFINQLLQGRALTIHGKGETSRSYLHVFDVAAAFEVILRKAIPGQVYNIGSNFEISVNQLAISLLETFGLAAQKSSMIQNVKDRKFNDKRYHIDSSKVIALGWQETVSWEDGLGSTIAWYKENTGHWGNIDGALLAHPKLAGEIVPVLDSSDSEGTSSRPNSAASIQQE